MIVCMPFKGERIPVTDEELETINEVVDGSAGKWNAPEYIQDLFWAAQIGNDKWVYLRSEGWHQKERYNGEFYKHVALHYSGWTYHLYTKVKSDQEEIKSSTHKIDYISYQGNKGFVNLSPTG